MSTVLNLTISEKIENVLIGGDLKNLNTEERVQYYNKVCSSLGLNTLTRPLEYLTLNGKLMLYARKDATDQLRSLYKVSVDTVTVSQIGDLYVVVASGSCGERKDSATGVINIKGLSGESLANAMMKAETKAKRRLTLSICGLGLLDETEIDDANNQAAQEKVVEATQRFEEPAAPQIAETNPQGEKFFAVKIAFDDRESREKVKQMGFKWDAKAKHWEHPEAEIGLEDSGIPYEIIYK